MNLKFKDTQNAFDLKQDGESAKITGYASTFGNKDSVGDVVVKGAYAQTIKSLRKREKNLPMLYQHDSRMPIGKFDIMKEDDRGLYVEGTILKSIEKGREAVALIENGIIDSMSIGYIAKDFDYDPKKNIRNLKDVDLREVSVVTFPANDQATIAGLKGDMPKTIREFEEFLRDAGFSREQAKAVASSGFKGIEGERDAGADADLIKKLEKFTNILKG